MRRKVNNSETHETKRYYEVPPEKVQEWSDTIEKLTKQRDQYKTERDTLIDDLSWYRAKVSRLERENEKLNKRVRKLNLNGQMQHDDLMMCDAESQSYKSFLSEISQHIGNKPSSSTYKYFRAKLDCLGIKEGE